MSFAEFLNMGGYAFYVWASYGATFIVLIGLVLSFNLQKKRIISQLKRRYRQQARAQDSNSQ